MLGDTATGKRRLGDSCELFKDRKPCRGVEERCSLWPGPWVRVHGGVVWGRDVGIGVSKPRGEGEAFWQKGPKIYQPCGAEGWHREGREQQVRR